MALVVPIVTIWGQTVADGRCHRYDRQRVRLPLSQWALWLSPIIRYLSLWAQ